MLAVNGSIWTSLFMDFNTVKMLSVNNFLEVNGGNR
jgi:hypothetical protein